MFSDPVVGKNFFGRKQILELLGKRISGLKDGYRQNIAIIGCELLGKSSILRHFLSKLNSRKIITVYLELTAEPFKYFADKFIRVMLYNFLIKNDLVVEQDLASLINASRQFIPKTIKAAEKIEEHLKKGEFNSAYELLLDLSAIIADESGKFCVIALDEFHLLANLRIRRPFSSLANKIMVQKSTMYIFASSKPAVAKKILAKKLSLLFGNFETIELKPFDLKSSLQFLKQRLEGLKINDSLNNFLVAFTDSRPFYLNILGAKLKDLARENNLKEITPTLVAEAIDSLIFNSQGILNQYFTNRLEEFKDCAAALVSIANSNKLRDAAEYNGFSRREFSSNLNRLIDKGIVHKNGSFLELNDHMLSFWIKSVYQRKTLSLTTDTAQESKDFQREIKSRISDFIYESQKDYTERLQELFRLFSNEIVEIRQKRYRLPAFAKVRSLENKGNKDYFIAAQDSSKYWITAISEERVSEDKVASFLEMVKRNGKGSNKKVLIALEGIDVNACILAKQQKVWTWDLDNVNLLLKFYNKSMIVR